MPTDLDVVMQRLDQLEQQVVEMTEVIRQLRERNSGLEATVQSFLEGAKQAKPKKAEQAEDQATAT